MNEPYLHIKNLKVNFKTFEGSKNVLNIDELKIFKGEAYGIIGESGTGKTILALSILKLIESPPGEIISGEILLEGEDLLKLSSKSLQKKVRGRKISMIFQDPMSTLNPVFTVGSQLENVIIETQGINRKKAYEKSVEMIKTVKLSDAERVMDKYPHELSGGQRQRVIIALALSCGADFIIADEPTRNLDVTIQAGILKLMKEIQKEMNVTILFIANNPGLISSICDKAGILYRGQIIEKGTTREVLKSPKHPYTFALLNAVPRSKEDRVDLNKFIMKETEESPADGCIFFSKCLKRKESCKKPQSLLKINDNHYVRCHLWEEDIV